MIVAAGWAEQFRTSGGRTHRQGSDVLDNGRGNARITGPGGIAEQKTATNQYTKQESLACSGRHAASGTAPRREGINSSSFLLDMAMRRAQRRRVKARKAERKKGGGGGAGDGNIHSILNVIDVGCEQYQQSVLQ